MKNIILYTTHCPKCRVLEMKLNQLHLEYEECEDVEKMRSLGLASAPALSVDGTIYNFKEAVDWLHSQEV